MTDKKNKEVRTLFFNFAHEDFLDKEYFLIGGGKRYWLTKVSDHPQVLAKARETNTFLRGVHDSQITHHLEDAVFATDVVTLSYVGADIDKNAGTWSMSSTNLIIPTSGVAHAYAMAREKVPNGPLPHSAKRLKYKLEPATTQQDMAEEAVLLDIIDHASTLVGLHPDLLSREPNSAYHIYQNHLHAGSGDIEFLAGVIEQAGPALPQQQKDQPNPSGWATLTPLTNDDGSPIKNPHTNRIQYLPDWNRRIDSIHSRAVTTIHPAIKNDVSLGADVTSLNPQSPPTKLQGKIWARHDGTTSVVHDSQAGLADSNLNWDYQQKNGEAGLFVSSPTVKVQDDGSVTITLNNVSNWFLRFLGMWLQFFDANGQVVTVDDKMRTKLLPDDEPSALDKKDALFVSIVPPAFTVAGIPVYPGQTSVTLHLKPDTDIQTIKVLYAGLGFSGSLPQDPEDITTVGVALTLTVNYGLVSLFMAVGCSNLDPVLKVLRVTGGKIIAGVIVSLINQYLKGGTGIAVWPAVKAIIKALLDVIAGKVAVKGLVALVKAITTETAEAEIIDSVPVTGQIARAVAAVVGIAQMGETSIEVALSPPVYEFDLSLTHDVSFNIYPDKENTQFPAVPEGYKLYYTVIYLFDNGSSPHMKAPTEVPDPTVKSIPVNIQGIPRGGKIKVSVGFYARASSTLISQNDWCAGQGSTGLQTNDVDTLQDIYITQTKIPISPTTQYKHTHKTVLDAAGKHHWTDTTAPPYVVPVSGQQPGDLGALRSITVRQGTATQQGYVGYAWQAYSSGLLDCSTNKRGQLDQAANLNTDAGNKGANAQKGYATTPCALQGGGTNGVTLAYSLLTQDKPNIYLDTTSLHVRPVSLGDSTSFAPPSSGQSFGQLNLDSARLLLHPAGHLVSINSENHKFETLRLPASTMADATATKYFLARTHSGQGSRPGLIDSPAALAVSPDGVILVLEDANTNNRIQAFDLGGNPVQYFKGQKTAYFMELDSTEGHTYLDLAVEFTGYLYVLSHDSDYVFQLDIYHPAQTGTKPICTTKGVNAARLAVNFWRSVYTLNYEVLQLPGGGYPSITEPSVSLWLPKPPNG